MQRKNLRFWQKMSFKNYFNQSLGAQASFSFTFAAQKV